MKTAFITTATMLALLSLGADANSTAMVNPLSKVSEMRAFHLRQDDVDQELENFEEEPADEEVEEAAPEEPLTYEEFAAQFTTPGYWVFVDAGIGLFTGVYGPIM
jgi:hypothetical protein